MTTRVFHIGFDTDRYQCLFVDSGDEEAKARARLDGGWKGASWDPPRVYADFLAHDVPDIWNLYESYAMVLSPRARSALAGLLLEAELLPLPVGDTTLALVNVVEVRNYLDEERTRWLGGLVGVIAEVPEFAAHRIGGPSLFKLPHDAVGLYCWEDDADPGASFRRAVLDAGLTGLTFEEIWSSDAGGRRPSTVPGL